MTRQSDPRVNSIPLPFSNLQKLSPKISYRFFLVSLLAISLLLRWALVLRGGQLFNPDEYRYLYCRVVAREFHRGNFVKGMTELTREAEHQGFKFFCVLPAMLEIKYGENLFIPGMFFSLFSGLNIALIWFLALRVGADEKEALLAVILAATSSALFYYASHLFPYDVAMTFGLLALYIGVDSKPGIWTSLLMGIVGFLAFFCYNGYWALVGFVFITHLFWNSQHVRQFFLKAVFSGVGFFAALLCMSWINGLFGNNLLSGYASFSTTITNGTFSEGGILPITYLWAAETWLFVLWLGLIVYAIVSRPAKQSSRFFLWLGAVLFIYGCLAIPAVVLHKFVVYGRLVRQLVPFLVLGSAFGLRAIMDNPHGGRITSNALLIVIIIVAGFNFRRAFLIIYPADFAKQVRAVYRDFKPPKNLTYFYTDNVVDVGPYKAYYIKYMFPLPNEVPPVAGKILMSAENPMSNFKPFRYEDGYSPEERINFPKSFSTMLVVAPDQ